MDNKQKQFLDDTLASLDAAIGSPSVTNRSIRKGRYSIGGGNLRGTTFNLQDVSSILSPVDTGNYKPGAGATDLSTVNESIMYDVTIPMSTLNQTEGNLDKTSAAILAQEDPGIKITQVLFSEFVNTFVSYQSSNDIWAEVSAYERICARQADLLKKLIRQVPKNHSSFLRTQNMALRLFSERNTWRLLASLYCERLSDPMDKTDDVTFSDYSNKSDKIIVEDLYNSSDTIREAQIVIDWLEKNAHDDYEGKYFDRVDYFGNTHVAWENTLRLKKNASTGKVHQRVLDQLDPDAPLREGVPLHDLDKEEDERLVKCMFSCIRAGQLSDAQDLCAKSGQHWRAATLEGWKLHNDPNRFTKSTMNQRAPVTGNPHRDIWKKVAFGTASDKRLGSYERAVYGSLCGHLPAMLTVCGNWEDTLWAHMKTLVDQNVEETLRQNSIHLRTMSRLPKEYPVEKLTTEGIFVILEAIAPTTDNAYHQLQKHLIRNDIAGLIQCGIGWLNDGAVDQHLLRCLAHIMLVLRRIWTIPGDQHERVTDILHACAKESMERGDVEQVAWYTSTLPKWLQVRTFASFLTNVCDEQNRKHALNLANLVRLDVSAITTTVVANLRLTPPSSCPDVVSVETTQDDKILIGAIDWLLYNEFWRAEAVRHANAIIRQFLIKRKVHAAKQLFNKLPADSMQIVIKLNEKDSGSKDLPHHIDNRVKEFLCYRSFFSGQDAFTEWFEYFYQKRPKMPKGPVPFGTKISFPEQLKHEQAMRTFEMEMERWNTQMDIIAKKAIDHLHNILLFPEGGFLVDLPSPDRPASPATSMDVSESVGGADSPSVPHLWSLIGGRPGDMYDDEWELYSHLDSEIAGREPCRQHQMETLRALYIPQACSLIANILQCMERHKECVQLADMVSSEQYQLYKCFSGVEMQQFLFKSRDSSKALLDKNCDALGYPVN